jgi:hypothetical protein
MCVLISLLVDGSSESYGRYAEVMVSSSRLPPHVYVILTIVAAPEQSWNNGRAIIWFLTQTQDLHYHWAQQKKLVPLSWLSLSFGPYKCKFPE